MEEEDEDDDRDACCRRLNRAAMLLYLSGYQAAMERYSTEISKTSK
jgi:hypothetical protein